MEIAVIFSTLAAAPLVILLGSRAVYFLARLIVSVLDNLPHMFTAVVPTWDEIVAAYVNTIQFFAHEPTDPLEDLPADEPSYDERAIVDASAKNEIEHMFYSNWLGVDVDYKIDGALVAKIDALASRLNTLELGEFVREGSSILLYRLWCDRMRPVGFCIKLHVGEYFAQCDISSVTVVYDIDSGAEDELCQFVCRAVDPSHGVFSADCDMTGIHYIPGAAKRASTLTRAGPKKLPARESRPTYGLVTDLREAGFECTYADGYYTIAPHINIIVGRNEKLYDTLTRHDIGFNGTRVIIEFIPTGERDENDQVVDLVCKYANFKVPGVWVLHVPDA